MVRAVVVELPSLETLSSFVASFDDFSVVVVPRRLKRFRAKKKKKFIKFFKKFEGENFTSFEWTR